MSGGRPPTNTPWGEVAAGGTDPDRLARAVAVAVTSGGTARLDRALAAGGDLPAGDHRLAAAAARAWAGRDVRVALRDDPAWPALESYVHDAPLTFHGYDHTYGAHNANDQLRLEAERARQRGPRSAPLHPTLGERQGQPRRRGSREGTRRRTRRRPAHPRAARAAAGAGAAAAPAVAAL